MLHGATEEGEARLSAVGNPPSRKRWFELKMVAESMTPARALESLRCILMVEVWFRLRDGSHLGPPRITEPESQQDLAASSSRLEPARTASAQSLFPSNGKPLCGRPARCLKNLYLTVCAVLVCRDKCRDGSEHCSNQSTEYRCIWRNISYAHNQYTTEIVDIAGYCCVDL